MNYKNLIVDANIFIALTWPQDSLHARAEHLVRTLISEEVIFHVNNYVVAEALTVTLLRSKDLARVQFLEKYFFHDRNNNLKLTPIDINGEKAIRNIFLSQQKYKGEFLSFADCSLIVQARKQNISTIFTFDQTFAQFKREFDIVGV